MTQQSNLLGWNGVKEICVVRLVGASPSQVSGRFCLLIRREPSLHWMSSLWRHSGNWHECSIKTILRHFVCHQTGEQTRALYTQPAAWLYFAPFAAALVYFSNSRRALRNKAATLFFALVCACQEVARVQRQFGCFWCPHLQLQRSMQGWWGKRQMDLRHEHADTPKLKACLSFLEQKMLKNMTNFQAQTERANFCSFPTENVKKCSKWNKFQGQALQEHVASNLWLAYSQQLSAPTTGCRRDWWQSQGEEGQRNMEQSQPMTQSNTNSWGKQMKGKTQNPETKRAHKINHLMGKNAYKAF